MSKKVNHNGQLISEDAMFLNAQNRVFRYGDGLFESIRVVEGQIPFLEQHLSRLKKGMQLLQYEFPEEYTSDFFEREISKLTRQEGNHRLRLTVYRQDGGFYAPQSNAPLFLIQSSPHFTAQFDLNKKGLHLGIYDQQRLPCIPLSNIKSCNALPYVLAGQWLARQDFDECLLLNQYGRIAECSIGNLFLVKGQELWTPPLSEGCIEGVMRAILLDLAPSLNLKVNIQPISIDDLLSANELGMTNAIRGIRWIEQFKEQRFQRSTLHRLVKATNDRYVKKGKRLS